MRTDLMKFFYDKGLFLLSSKIWGGIAILFSIVMIIYLFKGFFLNAIFCIGGVAVSYALHKFLISMNNQMRLRGKNGTKQ